MMLLLLLLMMLLLMMLLLWLMVILLLMNFALLIYEFLFSVLNKVIRFTFVIFSERLRPLEPMLSTIIH